jgi:hypothetical protein
MRSRERGSVRRFHDVICDGDAVVTGAVSDSAAMISFEFSVPIPLLLLFICLFALMEIGMDW